MPRRSRAAPTGRRRGDTSITAPGYGQFAQVLLQGIDAGDIIAMRLDHLTTGAFYWAFANANETVGG